MICAGCRVAVACHHSAGVNVGRITIRSA
jgi:hypothetical protein